MNRRIIYPGKLVEKEIILITGSVYGADISAFISSLADGIKADGHTVSIAAPGAVRVHCDSDQFGSPADWDMDYDVILVDMGEYLGWRNFRHGDILKLNHTRSLFITPVAENALTARINLPHENIAQQEVLEYLEQYLPTPIHLGRPSLSRQSSGERMISETNNDILLAIENGTDPDPELLYKRKEWMSVRILDRLPRLERRLW